MMLGRPDAFSFAVIQEVLVYGVIALVTGFQCVANEAGQRDVCFPTVPVAKVFRMAKVVVYVSSEFARGISKTVTNLDSSKEFTVFDPRIVKFSFVLVVALAVLIECFDVIDYMFDGADEFGHENPNC